ncbi:MAG: extracellular solute-binding protein [Deinococcota bacterium]
MKVLRNLGVISMLVLLTSVALGQTLSIWSGFPEMEAFYQRVADDFTADNPDVNIEILTQPLRDYERRITVALPSNSAADILEISSSFAARLVQGGLMPPLTEDLQTFVRSDAFNDFFVENASFDGNVYGVPLFRGQGALFYNTEMFEEAGLDGPPQTMEEYFDYAQTLTVRDDGGPTRSGWSLRLTGGGSGVAEKFWTILHQFEGSLVTQTEDGSWVAGYNNDAGAEALRYYVDLVNKLDTVNPELRGDAEGFQLGTTAMFIRESWVIGDIASKTPDLPYATALLPRGTIALPVNLYVTNDNPLAYEFIEYALKPEHQLWLVENVGWLPNRQDIDYTPVVESIPQLEAFLNIPEDHVLFTVPPISAIDEVQTRFAERLVAAYVNEDLVDNPEGIQAFLADAAEETNQILSRAGLQ